MRDPTIYAFDLFVIHAASDAGFVRGYLLPALNLPSSRVLLVDELMPGALVVSEIAGGLSRSRFTVVVLSPAYLADRWAVFGEQLASYVSVNAVHDSDVHVIPLRLIDCQLPLQLKARVFLDFTDRAFWEQQAARLRKLLHATAPATEQIACPYPGMRPFTEDEANLFWGRDREIEDLIGRLDRGEREIYVIGPSGSGKSSLVQAGLLHALESGSSRLLRSFMVRAMRPGERPSDRLAKVLEGDPAMGAATVGALVSRHPPAARILVFVDQLEELFTLTGAVERRQFFAALRMLRSESRCYLLLALRADFYGAFMDSEIWPDLTAISRLDVAPLRGPALAQAIKEPAMRVGVYLEARLCDRLVADAAHEPGALPLVQETLRMLWDKRRQRFLGLAAYEELGDGGRGLDVAITKRADTAMAALTVAQQAIARRVLLRLVSFGEGRADTRRQQQVQALRSAADDHGEFLRVFHRLVDDRLITVDGDEGDEGALADLSHEALITGWPALRSWIARRRADEQRRRRLETKVSEWIERRRGTASLLDPVELLEAEQWMQSDAARELGYGADLPALVAASQSEIDKVERQRRRRTFHAFTALIVFSVVASTLGLVAWRQRQKAHHLLGMNYLEHGRAMLFDGHPMKALPYLITAKNKTIESTELRRMIAQASRNMPLVTFVDYDSRVSGAAFSPDGTRVVTVNTDKTARVWDAWTGRPVTLPLEHRDIINTVMFSPDGTRVVTASNDSTARVWDVSTGRPVTPPLGHQSFVNAAAFSPDGKRVVTASADGTARIWDASTGRPVTLLLGHRNEGRVGVFSWSSVGPAAQDWAPSDRLVTPMLGHQVRTAMFSPDGTRVITASDDRTARIWDVSTGKPATPPLEHQAGVRTAMFSPDGTRVVTASDDKTARIWEASTGRPLTLPLEHQDTVNTVVFSPDGTRVVTASYDKTARVWDVSTGKPVTPPLEHQDTVNTAMFSPDGTRVVTASNDKTAQLWDAATGRPVIAPFEHQGAVWTAMFSSDGRRIVIASDDKMARVWDASTSTRGIPLSERRSFAHTAAFSRDGTRVVTASSNKTARVWDVSTGRPLGRPLEHQSTVNNAVFSPDGTRVMTASSDDTARIWDVSTGDPVTRPLEHQGAVNGAMFSPDGTRVVTASSDKTARVWDASTGEPVGLPFQHQDVVWTAVFSPDGKRVITASADKTARVWEVSTGKAVTPPLMHGDVVHAAVFSPDGTRVVTASADKTAQIWDASTGKPVTPPLEHRGAVGMATFSLDGAHVVTASADKTARVWNAWTGDPVTPPLEHDDVVHVATFSSDGKRVVTASADKTAQIWDASTGGLVTPPLDHQDDVLTAVFSVDGVHVATASRNKAALVWTLPLDMGSFDVVRCSPLVLVDGFLTTNPDQLRVCPRN